MPTLNKYKTNPLSTKIIYKTSNFTTIVISGLEIDSVPVAVFKNPISPNLGESEADFWVRAEAEINKNLIALDLLDVGGVFCAFGTPNAVIDNTEVLIKEPTSRLKNTLANGAGFLDFTLSVDGLPTIGNYESELQTFTPDVPSDDFEALQTSVAGLETDTENIATDVETLTDTVEEIEQQIEPILNPTTYNQQQLWLLSGIQTPN